MTESLLQDLPKNYESIISDIQDDFVMKLFSKFSYQYLNFLNIINSQDLIENHLSNHLINYKFITFNIYYINKNEYQNNINSINKVNVFLCYEKQCVFIEQINFYIFDKIIDNLSKNQISLINVSSKNINHEETELEKKAKIAIRAVTHKIQYKIKKNEFINNALIAIIGYLICRYFHSTDHFLDPSFFDFYSSNIVNERFVKSEFNELLDVEDHSVDKYAQIRNKVKQENHLIDFNENDFIILDTIHSNDIAIFYLVMHVESLYLFMMKKMRDHNDKLRAKVNEIYFCQKYAHRCMTHFYGFLKDNDEIIGFVYEYMSNGTLKSFISSNHKKKDKIFLLMTVSRILQGIEYLHSNKLIHRDIKPENIFIDHDFLPYISDFETIRHPKQEQQIPQAITANLGSSLYSSPEQFYGKDISYPTDIYSFGLLVYFIFNNKDLFNFEESLKRDNEEKEVKFMDELSENIQNIIIKCIKNNPENRLTINEIKYLFNTELNDFLFQESNLFNKESQIGDLIFETMIMQNDINDIFVLFITNFMHSLKDKNDNSNFLYILGLIYEKGIEVEQNYSKAKEYFDLSALQSNSYALYKLGKFYEEGLGVVQNYFLAKEYFEKSAKLNNSDALNSLGMLYEKGYCNEQSYLKAKEFYEKSAKLNNVKALNNLGFLYYHGYGVERNYVKAKEYYELAAKQEDSEALDNLGYLHKYGLGVGIDYAKAKYYFEKSAEQNNSHALNNLGSLYKNGQGVEQDYFKAKHYYELAAKLNNSHALNNLGYFYEKGYCVQQDYSKAKKYYEKSANLNNPKALNNLGYFHFYGLGVKQDYIKAKEYYEMSSKQNNSDALNNLGILYANGFGVEKNYLKAKYYFERSIEQNNTYAFNHLGNLYEKGNGVKQSYSKAIEYYELGIQNGNLKALNNLGFLYFYGEGINKNCNQAIKYYESSANQKSTTALNNLGIIFEFGLEVEQNFLKAKEYYELSAKLNDSYAMNKLGVFYEKGFGVEQNYSTAKNYYELSAKQNNSEALNNLGNLHYYGYGVKQNYIKAKDYYELSAKQNNSCALNNLGMLYMNGKGVEKNYLKAKEYYELSAKQNNSDALNYLGYFYVKGFGVKQNYSKAKYYYEQAAKLNNSNALVNLGILYTKGDGVEQDYTKAKELFEQAAEQSNPRALNNLAYLHYNGFGVRQSYSDAINFYEKSIQLNNSIASNNLGYILLNGLDVKKDESKAKNYFELAKKQDCLTSFLNLGDIYYNQKDFYQAKNMYEKLLVYENSEAHYKLGNLYMNDEFDGKDYLKAKKHYEKSALKKNPFSLSKIGDIYFQGLGVTKDCLKAIKYYKQSARQGNSEAFFKIGNIYYFGKGVKQNYIKAEKYYNLSFNNNNPDASYFLGSLYSSGEFFDVNISKASQYFRKSIDIHDGQIKFVNNVDKIHFVKNIYNNYYYQSNNDYGLICLLVDHDIKKATEYIKQSAFAEYPYGQNNFGLLYEIYENNIGNAIHMYERSSQNNFALAQYNLGHLKEKESKYDEMIEYYKKASEIEDSPLIFHGIEHIDKRLEISKTFIICMTNLKITKYYLKHSDYEESKKYFIKSFAKLKSTDNYQLNDKIDDVKDVFSYIRNYILHFPSFHLMNQPKLSSIVKKHLQSKETYSKKDISMNEILERIKHHPSYKDKYKIKSDDEEGLFGYTEINEDQVKNGKIMNDKGEFINDFGEMFDFIISNDYIKNIFYVEIHKIIKIMEEIVYTPPFHILFGRIGIENPKIKFAHYQNRKNINQLFYEGLKLDEFKGKA